MLDTLRDDEHLAWVQLDTAVPELNGQLALQNQEEVVRLIVLVPVERPFDLHNHEIVSVELAHCTWLVVLTEQKKLLR